MYIRHDFAVLHDAIRTPESREVDRRLIAKHTREFLASGGEVTVVVGYTAPVRATTGYGHQAALRGNKAGGNQKYFK